MRYKVTHDLGSYMDASGEVVRPAKGDFVEFDEVPGAMAGKVQPTPKAEPVAPEPKVEPEPEPPKRRGRRRK